MPATNKVVPGKWAKIRILFDDGAYSVIAGEYDKDFCLGEPNGYALILGEDISKE